MWSAPLRVSCPTSRTPLRRHLSLDGSLRRQTPGRVQSLCQLLGLCRAERGGFSVGSSDLSVLCLIMQSLAHSPVTAKVDFPSVHFPLMYPCSFHSEGSLSCFPIVRVASAQSSAGRMRSPGCPFPHLEAGRGGGHPDSSLGGGGSSVATESGSSSSCAWKKH